ncbi:CBM35 domain-containing protein [Modestobacter sp. Leaf380]|uniref:OmpL47-type beta-barrel domain-containing protein n=1 Tax=Modestobacter sp. Leaf380 TaxID=1736356 RepID=UPI0019105771|nr:CBM35 domain-containing protein [Modestobacter sp. Leaf380]
MTASLVIGGTLAVPPPTAAAATSETLAVDFDQDTGEFRGGASGTLYGFGDTGAPTRALVNGAHVTNTSQKPPFGTQHPSGDIFDVQGDFYAKHGQDMYVYMQDYYPDWAYNGGRRPGDDRSYDLATGEYANQPNGTWDYLEVVRIVATELASDPDRASDYVLIPFNEPDGGNWYGDRGVFDQFFLGDWDAVHAVISEVYTAAGKPVPRIGGPGDASWQRERTDVFMTHAQQAGNLPEIAIWHELGIDNLATFPAHLAEYRAIEDRLGIADLPVNITEYGLLRDMSVPGQLIQWFSMFEDAKVDAQTAYWNYAGNLSDNTARANGANAGWWLFKWYGDLEGSRTVAVTPPQPDVPDTLQGIGAVDTSDRRATVLYGGSAADQVQVAMTDLDPAVFGGAVDVEVREAPLSGAEGLSATPRVVQAAQDVALSDGDLTLTVSNLDRYAGYQVVVTPAGDSTVGAEQAWSAAVEAEDTRLSGAQVYTQSPTANGGWNFLASGGRDVGSFNNAGSRADWTVEVPRDGTYRFQVVGATPGRPGQHALFVDGAAAGTVQYAANLALNDTSRWKYRGSTEMEVELTAGSHTLSVRASADGTTVLPNADITLDRFLLTDVTDGERTVHPASTLRFYDGAGLDWTTPDARGFASISGDQRADLYVSAWEDGYHDVVLDHVTQGASSVSITVNGRAVPAMTTPGAGSWASTARVFLSEGINEIEVRSAGGTLLQQVSTVRTPDADAAATRIEAESGVLAGGARVGTIAASSGSNVTGGASVGYLGRGATLTIPRQAGFAAPGDYEVVVSYANAETIGQHAYNPQVIDRRLQVTEAGTAVGEAYFRYTYAWNSFQNRTIPVTLTTSDAPLVFGNAGAFAPDVNAVTIAPTVLGTPTTVSTADAEPTLSTTSAPAPNAAGWVDGPVTVTGTATDDAPAPTVEYRLDGGAWAASTTGLVVGTDGPHVVGVRAVDSAGQYSAVQDVPVQVDATDPTLTLRVDRAARTVTATAADATSGVAATEWSLDGGTTWSPYTAPVTVGAARTDVVVRTVDVAGNSARQQSTVEAAVAGATASLSSADEPVAGWYGGSVLVTLTKPAGPASAVQYRVDGGSWRTYSRPFTVSANGAHTVDHRLLRSSVVVAGSEGQVSVSVDTARPTVSVAALPSASGTPRNPVRLTFAGTDAHSGLAGIEYRVGNGAWTAAPADGVRFDTVGSSLVSYRSADVAGNVSTVRSLTVAITADVTPSVRALSSRVAAGGYLTVAVAGFDRWDLTTLSLGPAQVSTVLTGADGSARITFQVPADTVAGATTLTARGSDGDPVAQGRVTVTR